MSKLFRLIAAALFALAVMSMSLVGALSPASAEPVPAPNASNINAATPVSLTLHKYAAPTWDQTACPADGTVLLSTCTDGKTALPGAKFEITPVLYNGVAIDLTTNEGWAQAATFYDTWTRSMTTLPTGYTLGTPTEVITGADGSVTFPGTKTLYVVEETQAPAGGYSAMVTPFAVTLPMATADGTAWIYDVQAYPKNNKDDVTKTVSDLGSVGSVTNPKLSTITYTIASSITPGYVPSVPAPAAGQTVLTFYRITDTLDPRLAPPAADTVKVAYGTDAATATALTYGTDYTVTVTGQQVVVVLTQAGLDKIVVAKNGAPATKVFTTIAPTLVDANCYTAPETGQVACSGTEIVDGVIKNTASVVPNQNSTDSDGKYIEIPSNTVDSKYADIQVIKTNDQDTDNLLQGAEFALYRTNDCSATGITGLTPIGSGTTDDNGQITWKSIQISTYYNGKLETASYDYCVVETKQPVGYVMPADPYHAVTLAENETGLVDITTVVNMEQAGNQLPLTGGEGIAAMSIGGLLLIGGGVAYYVATSRKRKVAA